MSKNCALSSQEKSQASARDGMYSHNGSRSAPKMLASLLNRRRFVSQCLFNVGSRIHGMTPISSWCLKTLSFSKGEGENLVFYRSAMLRSWRTGLSVEAPPVIAARDPNHQTLRRLLRPNKQQNGFVFDRSARRGQPAHRELSDTCPPIRGLIKSTANPDRH